MSARKLSSWNWIWKASLTIFFALLIHTTTAWAGSAALTWDPPTTKTDSTPFTDLAGYKIYYGLAPGQYITTLDVGNVTQFQVNKLSDAVTHYFAVTAYNTSGYESSYSNECSIIKLSSQTLPPVLRNSGFSQSWYSSIQTACNTALDGDDILTRTTDLFEDLFLNNGLTLSIYGGYDANFNATGVTTVHGTMIVGPGSVRVHNLILQFQ